MLRETIVESTDPNARVRQPERLDWRTVDRALRDIARRRAELDANEARWLREAERLQIWRPLGMVSALDYLERTLGYSPRKAHDRLRVARALAALPELERTLEHGDLAFSAVRELIRVATPATEAQWVAAARGSNLRQIEDLVSGHRPGDLPNEPADPDLRTRVVRYELSPASFALLRQTRATLDAEHPQPLDDDQFLVALCEAALEACIDSRGETGRAKFQIAITVCDRCDQAWQESAGAQIAVDAATLERARCDAQHIGSLTSESAQRAYQDVPPATVRLVWRRDGGRCQTPGCRSARGLEIHHIVRRADGGTHEPCNLTLRCSRCHASHHAGQLKITGTAPDHLETHRCIEIDDARPAHVGRRPEITEVQAQARQALVGLGFKPAEARAAVDQACQQVAADAPVEELIRAALCHCPKPILARDNRR